MFERDALAAEALARAMAQMDTNEAEGASLSAVILRRKADDFLARMLGPSRFSQSTGRPRSENESGLQ